MKTSNNFGEKVEGSLMQWILTKLDEAIIDSYSEFYFKSLKFFKDDDCGVTANNWMTMDCVKSAIK